MIKAIPVVLVALLVLTGVTLAHEEEPPAFPGAEGFGSQTVGGRGGQVIEVTTLFDSGAGSLRAAIEAEGPRTVIFKVAGTITLINELVIRNPYITIAGQTAPGGGILLRNHSRNDRPALSIETHDVIVRYLRLRPGPSATPSCCLDALQIHRAHNVIIDHVSLSWGTDGQLDVTYSDNITVQWSIIAEGLRNSTHANGRHSTGTLVDTDGKVSLHHNLYAHNDERNPRLGGANPLDVVNNVIYDPGAWPTVITAVRWPAYLNYVSNFIELGSSSPSPETVFPIAVLPDRGDFPIGVFVSGNIYPGWDAEEGGGDHGAVRPENRDLIVDKPYDAPPITTTSAEDAFRQVLAKAGANFPRRDAVDERILADVVNGTGGLIDDPAQVGGWPKIENGTPYLDSDHDGMPDDYERAQGFDPDDPDDGAQDADDNGYTNLEEFLNALPLSGSS